MKVKALTSFVGHYGNDRATIVAYEGMIFDLPDGTDWINCGFVEPLEEDTRPRRKPRRTAARKPKEKTVTD